MSLGYMDLLACCHMWSPRVFQICDQNGCPSGRLTCSTVAKNGHLECLKYAHENGLYWNRYTCSIAALNGHLECLKYAHENLMSWNEYTCQFAASNGHLESTCSKYARTKMDVLGMNILVLLLPQMVTSSV